MFTCESFIKRPVEEKLKHYYDAKDLINLYISNIPEGPDAEKAKSKVYEIDYYVERSDKANEHLNAGNDYFDSQQYESAIYEYKEALKSDPTMGIAYNNMGCAYQRLDKNQRPRRRAAATADRARGRDQSTCRRSWKRRQYNQNKNPGTFIIYLYGMYGLYMVDQVYPLDISVSYLWPAAAFGLSLLLVYIYATPRWGTRARNVAVMAFGILIGSYLPLVIGTWTSLLILMGFALYDIYSVRKGPIKEMMEHIQEDLTTEGTADDKFDVDDIDLDIGIGDLAFYSMLTSITLISAEWGGPALVAITENALAYFFPFILTIIGVLLGAFISYEFVKKAKIIPGLPMSIFIGIGLLSLAMLIGPLIF